MDLLGDSNQEMQILKFVEAKEAGKRSASRLLLPQATDAVAGSSYRKQPIKGHLHILWDQGARGEPNAQPMATTATKTTTSRRCVESRTAQRRRDAIFDTLSSTDPGPPHLWSVHQGVVTETTQLGYGWARTTTTHPQNSKTAIICLAGLKIVKKLGLYASWVSDYQGPRRKNLDQVDGQQHRQAIPQQGSTQPQCAPLSRLNHKTPNGHNHSGQTRTIPLQVQHLQTSNTSPHGRPANEAHAMPIIHPLAGWTGLDRDVSPRTRTNWSICAKKTGKPRRTIDHATRETPVAVYRPTGICCSLWVGGEHHVSDTWFTNPNQDLTSVRFCGMGKSVWCMASLCHS